MAERVSVAVVVTSYNDGRYLDESVGSAVDLVAAAQGPVDVSVMIADDGSTERRTVEVLERFERRGFPVLWLRHRGPGATRNAAVASTNADWFIPLDADNRLRPSMLDQLLSEARRNPNAAAVYGDAMRFGDRTGEWKMGPTDPERLRRENHIDTCALIRRAAWERVGGYSEKMQLLGVEDWDLWLRFLDGGMELAYVAGIAFEYRVRDDSLINRPEKPTAVGEFVGR